MVLHVAWTHSNKGVTQQQIFKLVIDSYSCYYPYNTMAEVLSFVWGRGRRQGEDICASTFSVYNVLFSEKAVLEHWELYRTAWGNTGRLWWWWWGNKDPTKAASTPLPPARGFCWVLILLWRKRVLKIMKQPVSKTVSRTGNTCLILIILLPHGENERIMEMIPLSSNGKTHHFGSDSKNSTN